MLHKKTNKVKRPIDSERAFPWRCRHCGQDQVFLTSTSYEAEVRHDGSLYVFKIPSLKIPICRICHEKVFTEKVDSQINAGLRSHLRLLTPDEIRAALERVSMTQRSAAETLGIAEETLSRWLNETQIQTRAMDNLLRVFFAFPVVRNALSAESRNPRLGTADFIGKGLKQSSPTA